jgi:hypothetical protein
MDFETTPAVTTFLNGYKAKYGATIDTLPAIAYEAGYILDAIRHAGNTNGPDVHDALKATKLGVITG